MNLGLYLHIPFCRLKCDYCSFYSIDINNYHDYEDLIDKYSVALSEELKRYSDKASGYIIDTIYIGGGTPSLLSSKNIKKILNDIHGYFKVGKECEITIEANPEDLNMDSLDYYIENNINRVTLGIQSLSPDVLSLIGRNSKKATSIILEDFFTRKDIIRCVDFISGIPDISLGEYNRKFTEFLNFVPDHVSVYLLTIEKGTPLYKRLTIPKDFDELQVNHFSQIKKILENKNYEHYEISNFAKDNKYSKHNLKYWNFDPYIGFGPGAHSFFNSKRWFNQSNLQGYLNNDNIKIIDDRNIPDMMTEFIMISLRTKWGLDSWQFHRLFKESIPYKVQAKIDKNIKQGLLEEYKNEKNNICYRITGEGFFISDSIVYDLVESLI